MFVFLLRFDWRDVAKRFKQALLVEPTDPLQGFSFDLVFGFPGPQPVYDLSFQEVDDHLGQRVVISYGPDYRPTHLDELLHKDMISVNNTSEAEIARQHPHDISVERQLVSPRSPCRWLGGTGHSLPQGANDRDAQREDCVPANAGQPCAYRVAWHSFKNGVDTTC